MVILELIHAQIPYFMDGLCLLDKEPVFPYGLLFGDS